MRNLKTMPGSPLPLGAHVTKNGIQFSIFSRHCHSVTLLLFESDDPDSPFIEVPLDPELHRTGDIWHILVEGLPEQQLYGYSIDGPYEPEKGHRFNKNKLLIDPCARAITGNRRWDLTMAQGYDADSPDLDLSFSTVSSIPHMPRCIALDRPQILHGMPLRIPERDYIIYELHVKGFTCHESSGVAHGGTFGASRKRSPT